MFDAVTISLVIVTFLLAGLVKGVIGMGLPTVSLALLTVTVGLPNAMALLLVPSLVTNVWQGAVGGHFRFILSKSWPFLLLASVCVFPGAFALKTVDFSLLAALLGGLLIIYASVALAGVSPAVSERQRTPVGLIAGVLNGILTGMTGSFVFPGVLYLQALGLNRHMLVQAMGVLFTVSTLALMGALGQNRLLSADLGLLSLTGLPPALAGMYVGQKVRNRLSEQKFRKVFFISLLLLGAYIVLRGLENRA